MNCKKNSLVLTSPAGFTYLSQYTALSVLLGNVFFILLFRIIISINRNGVYYFSSIWNLLDVSIAILFGMNFILKWKNILHTVFTLPTHLNTSAEEGYFSFSWVRYYNGPFILFHSFLNFFSAIRLFKHFFRTFHVTPLVATLLSVAPNILRISFVVLPLIYFHVNRIESLLFNSRPVSAKIPLTNKVGLSIFASNYQFPDERYVPYLYCQFCSCLIVIFSAIILHHYVIAKYNTRIISGTVDVIEHLQENIRKRRVRNQSRLRGGADRSSIALPARDAICLMAIQDLLQQPYGRDKESSLKHMKNLVNLKIKQDKKDQENQREISLVFQNLEGKLDKILEGLNELQASL